MEEGGASQVRVRERDGDYGEYSRIVWMKVIVLRDGIFIMMVIMWIAQWRFDH